MSGTDRATAFEQAFHRSAQRHERVWIFLSVTMLVLLLVGTLFFAVLDYGLITKNTTYFKDPTEPDRLAMSTAGGITRTGPKNYAVYMIAHLWSWTPNSVHVRQGAAITFHVTSTDVLHGFEVQGTAINVTAVPGLESAVTYVFHNPGNYNIICNEFCGIEHQAMIGQIVVDPETSP